MMEYGNDKRGCGNDRRECRNDDGSSGMTGRSNGMILRIVSANPDSPEALKYK
jgi:hypothetical protein